MRTKVKKVYYCEFCKKHSLLSNTLANHEKYCTMNPDRECRVCKSTLDKKLVEKYQNSYSLVPIREEGCTGRKVIWKDGKPISKGDIMNDVNGCPACALAIFRQSPDLVWILTFNYEEEMKKFWEKI